MTHHAWFDPSNDSAALEQEREVFEPMIGKIVIPARQDYFDMPLIGSIIAIGGAKPIARKKDLAAYYAGQGLADEEIAAKLSGNGEARKEANGLIQGLMVRMAKAGFVYASYVEGTRNRGDQSQLQPVRGGIQNLLEAMDEPEAAKIICLGHDYGGARILKKRYLTPTVYIDAVDAPSDLEETEELLTKTLQGCLDGAIENRYAGAPLSTLAKAATLAAVAGGAILADRLMSRDTR
jgi:hypothetical protein